MKRVAYQPLDSVKADSHDPVVEANYYSDSEKLMTQIIISMG